MNVIRVLHAIGKMNRGGAETFLMELYRHIDRKVIQFDFLMFQYDDDEGAFDNEILRLGGNIYRFKMPQHKSPISFYRKLRAFFLKDNQHIIVHSHQYTMSGFITCAARKSGKLTISHAHAIRKKGKLGIRELYDLTGSMLLRKYSDYYFGCSEEALYSLTHMHADNKKAFLVKNAIDPNKFYFSHTERTLQQKKYGITYEKIIGCVARFSKVKNHRFMIEIFKNAFRLDPSLRLMFLGEGDEEEEIKTLVHDYKLDKYCYFMGLRSDVDKIINLFDVFCLPSLNEGLGIVYIEAQCNGLNCIAPLETVPEETDIGAGSLYRVSINASAEEWAAKLIEVTRFPRVNCRLIKECIEASGYDINLSQKWLQAFYINSILDFRK